MMEGVYDDSGELTSAGSRLESVDTLFTALFTAELLFNAIACGPRSFLADGWNIFDLLTISLSLLALALDTHRLPVNIIRSLRALRMLRLLGKLKSLKNIVTALSASILPVLQSFLIVLVVIAICPPSALPRPAHLPAHAPTYPER